MSAVDATPRVDPLRPETIVRDIPIGTYEETEYTDFESMSSLLNEWAAAGPNRAWEQIGDQEDAVIVFSYWDTTRNKQFVDLTRFYDDAEAETGFGWSTTGFPFTVQATAPGAQVALPGAADHEPEFIPVLGLPNLFSTVCACGRSAYGSSLLESAKSKHLRHVARPDDGSYRDAETTARLFKSTP